MSEFQFICLCILFIYLFEQGTPTDAKELL